MTIPRLRTLSDAYAERRRSEITQLWLVIRHAQGEDDSPEAILPPRLTDAQHIDIEPGGFDPLEMVRRQRDMERG